MASRSEEVTIMAGVGWGRVGADLRILWLLRKTGGGRGGGRRWGTDVRAPFQVPQRKCEKWSNTDVSGRESREIY